MLLMKVYHSLTLRDLSKTRHVNHFSGTGNGVQGINNADEAVQPKGSGKTRRSRSQRPKSLATGVKASNLPQKQSEDPECELNVHDSSVFTRHVNFSSGLPVIIIIICKAKIVLL